MIFSQPLWWEYAWCVSLALSFWGLAAARRNRISTMQRYMAGIGLFGVGPLLYGAIYYFGEAWTYITTGDKEKLFVWQVSTEGITAVMCIVEYTRNCILTLEISALKWNPITYMLTSGQKEHFIG
jgi:hypothetical protein